MTYFNLRIPYSNYLSQARSIVETLTLLSIRGYLFSVFFFAGFNKLKNWDSTLFLFEYEYTVPLLRHDIAAYMGTATEILLPSLLLFGFMTRISAIFLFIFNIVAVMSLSEIAPAALLLHVIWGGLIYSLILWGAGKISIDSARFNAGLPSK
jgi:putative oxidoreductase